MRRRLKIAAYEKLFYIAAICIMLIVSYSYADTPVFVKVTVLEPLSCTINNNQLIQVNFGNVIQTDKVDGKNYMAEVKYGISCTNNGKNAMKMKIIASAADFDSQAIKMNKANLGVALYNSGRRIALNEWFNFTWPDKPKLTAAPVRKAGASLDTGQFSGAATMMMDYQ